MAELGDPTGLDVARDGVNMLTGLGARSGAPGCMAVLAEMCAKYGEIDEGLAYVELGEALALQWDQNFYTSEIHRSQALLHLRRAELLTGSDADEALSSATTAAQRGIEMARSQDAASLELRAIQPMIALLRQRAENREAFELLTSTVAKFPPASHGIDLEQARAEVKVGMY